jgi:ribulose-5-phosphate 4-epimerase/fuculose-1-phosphate aldolase
MSDVNEELREKVVLSCRILAMEGLVEDILGHVSARTADRSEMWIRCRSQDEQGVRYTIADGVRRVDFDGKGSHLEERYRIPNELPIHGEIFKQRPEVGCVTTLIRRKRSFAASPGYNFGRSSEPTIYQRCAWHSKEFRSLSARTW